MFGGFDRVIEYGPQDVDPLFRKKNREIFSYSRGAGLWLWKPYLIYRSMLECEDGDYLFYTDSGAIFLKSIDQLICDVWVSDIPLLEESFTKSICFEQLGCNNLATRKSNQIQATFLLLKNSDFSRKFVSEWLEQCQIPDMIEPVNHPSAPLISHREDQSILSLLCKRYKIKPHRDPSQRGWIPETYENPSYPFKVAEHDDDY